MGGVEERVLRGGGSGKKSKGGRRARRARVKWTMGDVLPGSTKALVSKPPEVYIPLLETGTGRGPPGFRSNKTPGCIEGTEISKSVDCKN